MKRQLFPRRSFTPRYRLAIAAKIAAAMIGTATAAQDGDLAGAAVGNPPRAIFETDQVAGGAPADAAAPALAGAGGEVEWTARIRLVDGEIYNPASGAVDKVRLRAYQGAATAASVPFVAPTVNLEPGETFRLNLVNELPEDDPSCPGTGDVNVPHCFNATNMHTHGLWISPTGNSDNVLLRINPGHAFTYEYNIPVDHPAGTFWYHPHLHGSTALQVSSGMAGALIIHGNRLPQPDKTGDIDTLLRNDDGTAFQERVILLQQIPYACRDDAGNIKKDADGFWVCDKGDIGTIESYEDQFGPPIWAASGRYTTINGRTVPTFDGAVAGKIERWRLIHAGVRDSIKFQFHKLAPGAQAAATSSYSARSAEEQERYVNETCEAAPLPQFSLATDGLTRDALRAQTASDLHPGYRDDLLVTFPEPGIYCLVDGEAPGNETVSTLGKSQKLLGFVRVGPGPGTGGAAPADHLRVELIAAAKNHMPTDMLSAIVADLESRLGLAAFEPHQTLVNSPPDGLQTLGFRIAREDEKTVFQIGSLDKDGNIFEPKSYDPGRIDRALPLGETQDWDLRSFAGGHPFHIHVNPFQIVEVLDAEGRDVSNHDPDNSSIYAGLKGAWKDTLFVTGQRVGEISTPYRIRVRTKYQRYIGEFVLHCHILDHEDQGMMQNVRIGLTDGQGGILEAHH